MPLLVRALECDELGNLVIGQQIGLRIYVTDLNHVLTDTGTVTMTLRRPDGTNVTADVAHEAPGTYFATLPIFDQGGIWHWIVQTIGLINLTAQGTLHIHALAFTP